MENINKILKETFIVGESFLVDTKEMYISAPQSIKEEDYPQEVKDLLSNGYKLQLNIL